MPFLSAINHSSLMDLNAGDDHPQYVKLAVSSYLRNVITSDEWDGICLTIRVPPVADTGGTALLITDNAFAQTWFKVGENFAGTGYVFANCNLYIDAGSTLYFSATPLALLGTEGYVRATSTTAAAGYLDMSANGTRAGGYLKLQAGATAAGGFIDTSNGGGSINTTGTGSIQLGVAATRTTLNGSGTTVTCTLPAITGTLASLAGVQSFTGAKTFSNNTLLLGGASSGVCTVTYTSTTTSRTHTVPLGSANSTFIVALTPSTTAGQICQATATSAAVSFATMSGDATYAFGGALTISNNAVSLAKMADMATASFLGRNTAGTGDPEVLSMTTARNMLSINNVENTALSTWTGSANITTLGTVTTGTWNPTTIAISRGGTGQTTANAAFNALAPSQTGQSGKFLTTNGTDASWATVSSSPAGSNGQVQFNSSGSFGGDANLFWDNTNKRLGVGSASPNSMLEIKPASSSNLPAVRIDQTLNEAFAFIRYEGVSASNLTKNITTKTTGMTLDGFVRVNVNGSEKWMPFYIEEIVP